MPKVGTTSEYTMPWRRKTGKKPRAPRMKKTQTAEECDMTELDEDARVRKPILKGMGGGGVVKRKNIFRGFRGR